METQDYATFFSKKNENSYIYLLHEYGIFDKIKFDTFIDTYHKLVHEYSTTLDTSFKKILSEATDILSYTLCLLSYHHNKIDAFTITNYNDFDDINLDGEDYLDTYISNKIRTALSAIFE